MHLHILGICGTFMAGVALLARQLGHTVSGCDQNVYPPMSTQLQTAGIDIMQGFQAEHVQQTTPDCVVIGNAMTRGNPAVEYVLNSTVPFTSGPQWLAEHVLRERWVLGVAGTHGKTTTSSLLAWILEWAGLQPGFLIGGIAENFAISARLGDGSFFVIEADEYDSALFDKRAKFIHYRPRTTVLNNLEFDHADIFPDLAAIQRQFHHLVRSLPSEGLIVSNGSDTNLEEVLKLGCWTPVERFIQGDWHAERLATDGSQFRVYWQEVLQGEVQWSLVGEHNIANALAAIAAARHVGVPSAQACLALAEFAGVKRRLELHGEVAGVSIYDDFAHHPTAIATTLKGMRAKKEQARIIAVFEPRSNTLRMGQLHEQLAPALNNADAVIIYQPPELEFNLNHCGQVCHSIDATLVAIVQIVQAGDQVVIMSNGGFGGIHERLLDALKAR